MEVQRIETEGPRIDRVRNQRRMVVEVEAIPVNGCVIEGHHVRRTARIEIYADRLDDVLARTRTMEHDRIEAAARKMADNMIAQAVREQHIEAEWAACTTDEQRRDLLIEHRINFAWPQFLRMAGGVSDLPPLRSCKVVHRESGDLMDARAWLRMPQQAQTEWLDDPPHSPETASALATRHLADALDRVFTRRESESK